MCRKGAYEGVAVTRTMQDDFTERVYPAVKRAAWAWFRGSQDRDCLESVAECLAVAWKLYLSDIARRIVEPSAGALASYARRQVWAGSTLLRPGGRNGDKAHKDVPLHYVDPDHFRNHQKGAVGTVENGACHL